MGYRHNLHILPSKIGALGARTTAESSDGMRARKKTRSSEPALTCTFRADLARKNVPFSASLILGALSPINDTFIEL